MALPFDEQDIRAAFDAATFQRGAHYTAAGAVRGLELGADGRRLWAQVRGTQRRPYRTQVTVSAGRGRRIVSYCTCPVGAQCKHGVAVMLAALRADRPAASMPSPNRRHRARRRHHPTRWQARWALGWPGWRRPSARLRRPRGRRRSRCSICCRPGPWVSGRRWRCCRAARRLKAGGWGADRD